MKVLLLCLFLFLREASCGVVEAPSYGAALVAETGTSTQHRSQDIHGNYDFGYEEKHTSGGSFRQETGDAYGNKVGSYGLTDADGRVRIVKYVADANGFRVIVNTNEPGTAPSTPAAASINVPQEPVVPAPTPVAQVVGTAPLAPVATAPVAAIAVSQAPVVKTVVTAAEPVVTAPAPAVLAAPAVTTFKRFVPASLFAGVAAAAPAVQAAAVPAAAVFGYRRAPAPFVPAASPLAPASYSAGFVPSLPYAASAIAPPPRRVIVRKVVPAGYAGYGGAYGLVRGTATSYAAPAGLAAPAVYGAKLSVAVPAYTYGPAAVVPTFASKPLDYYEHLANKLGATYLRRRR